MISFYSACTVGYSSPNLAMLSTEDGYESSFDLDAFVDEFASQHYFFANRKSNR